MNRQPRYRIVRDNYSGFEAQVKYWWWPFWLQIDYITGCNTSYTVEQAREVVRFHYKKWLKNQQPRLVEYVDVSVDKSMS